MRARPDFTPGVAGNEILKFGVERRLARIRLVDPGVAERLAALGHAGLVALTVVHASSPSVVWLLFSLREETQDFAGKCPRLLDVGNMGGGLQHGEGCSWDSGLDVDGVLDRCCH